MTDVEIVGCWDQENDETTSDTPTQSIKTIQNEKKPWLEPELSIGNNSTAKQSYFGAILYNGKRICGYVVSKKGYKEHQWEKHRKWLTITPQDPSLFTGIKSQKPESYTLYYENKDYFIVPRGYGYARWGVPAREKFNKAEKMQTIEFRGSPLGLKKHEPPQITTINKIMEQFGLESKKIHLPKNHWSLKKTTIDDFFVVEDKVVNGKPTISIISLPCGFGKTVIGLFTFWKIGLKLIVFFHRENLMDGWVEDIRQFLPQARIGIIQGKKCDYKNKDIVLCMIQSAISHDYPSEMWNSFGAAIIDECHHGCAKTFCRLFEKLSTRYVLGLSATPYRKDNLDHLLNWFMGPIIVREKRICDGVLCTIIYYSHPKQKEICIGDKPMYARMITKSCNEKPRNEFSAKAILECFLHPKPLPIRRKILIVSERSEEKHLTQLRHCLFAQLRQILKNSNDGKGGDGVQILEEHKNKWRIKHSLVEDITIGVLVGGMDLEQRNIAKSCDLLLSTIQCVEEGFNLPRLDTCFVISIQRNDIEQLLGRILRPHPDKNVPMFVEIADNFSFFKAIASKHVKYLTEMGYTVQEIVHHGA